ncbi:MAG: hypothetical protein HC934_12275 [Acaryochloridaceae cyanobacterium SU_2_1]|nr:hypothetical protein [Acaryochloridaceae cyanobacterium SU_2_1]
MKERVVAQAQPQAKPTKPQRSLSQPPEESSRPAVGVKKPTDQTDKPAAKTKPVPLSSTDSRPPVKSTPKTQPKPAQDPIAKADSSPAPELPEVVASGTVATLDKAKETITSAVAEIPTPIDSSSEVASNVAAPTSQEQPEVKPPVAEQKQEDSSSAELDKKDVVADIRGFWDQLTGVKPEYRTKTQKKGPN